MRTHAHAIAAMSFALSWQSENARHQDCLVVNKLNLWRDILPPQVEPDLMDKPAGHVVERDFAAGELLPGYREQDCLRIPSRAFNRKLRRQYIELRTGRFYPRGFIGGVRGIFPEEIIPFRVAEVREDELTVDLNHPPLRDTRSPWRHAFSILPGYGEFCPQAVGLSSASPTAGFLRRSSRCGRTCTNSIASVWSWSVSYVTAALPIRRPGPYVVCPGRRTTNVRTAWPSRTHLRRLGRESALNGIDPLAFVQSLAGRIDDMTEHDEIERSLDDLEYVMEILDPELQGPAYEMVERLRAKLEEAGK